MYEAKEEVACDESIPKSEVFQFQLKEEVIESNDNLSEESNASEDYKEKDIVKEELPVECILHKEEFDIEIKAEIVNEEPLPRGTHSLQHEEQADSIEKKQLARPYKCVWCEKSFPSGFNLNRHVLTHSGETPFKCDECEKEFSQECNLLRHKKRHTGEKNHKCDKCEKEFVDSGDLTRHKRTHTGEKPFKCALCEKAFSEAGKVTIHMRRLHTGERPHKCDSCEKAFITSDVLKLHKRIHNGEQFYKLVKCDICEKTFSGQGNLLKHKKLHTGEKHFMCDTCGKEFVDAGDLQKHTRRHTGEKPYKCDVCKKAFTQSQNLTNHKKRLHEKDNWKFVCRTCNEQFFSLNTLREHVRTHTGNRPYSCNICNETFPQNYNGRYHMKNRHGGDFSQLNYDKSIDVPDSHDCLIEYTSITNSNKKS